MDVMRKVVTRWSRPARIGKAMDYSTGEKLRSRFFRRDAGTVRTMRARFQRDTVPNG